MMSGHPMDRASLAAMIDQSLLKPEVTEKQVEELCAEADQYGFGAVFVNSCHVRRCADLLSKSKVKVGTVSGSPLGTPGWR